MLLFPNIDIQNLLFSSDVVAGDRLPPNVKGVRLHSKEIIIETPEVKVARPKHEGQQK